MKVSKFIVISKIGPYDSVYTKNLITFKLKNINSNNIITWHETGERGLNNANVGDVIVGIKIYQDNKPNYKQSNPKNTQLNLF